MPSRIARPALFALLALMASCSEPPPPPVRAPAPPASAPAPAPASQLDWQDAPLTPGSWSYAMATRVATYQSPSTPPALTLQCDRARQLVALAFSVRAGDSGRIITSFGERPWNAVASGIEIPVSDPFLDKIAYSRGRFAIVFTGGTRLILPSWPEVARVIEDCREP